MRKVLDKPSTLKKFMENGWRFFFYSSILIYGFWIMFSVFIKFVRNQYFMRFLLMLFEKFVLKKPWMWDTKEFWNGYPYHDISNDIYWYYTIKIGFYYAVVITQFFDVKRKDFWLMFAHHIVTILLLNFSYACNFTRVGSFIVLLHDCVDVWIEFGKLASYLGFQRLVDFSLITFSIVWLLTRLILFPIR